MLSGPVRRRRVLALAWRPAVRGMDARTAAAAVGLALAPTLLALLRGSDDFGASLLVAVVVLGAAAAVAVEDPAEETLAASPTGVVWRRLVRMSAIAVATALVIGTVVAVSLGADGITAAEVARRAVELAAVAGVSAGLAAWAARAGLQGAAHGGAVGGALAVLLIAAFAQRYRWLPSLGTAPHHERWWLVAAAGWAAAAWASREPAR